MSLKKKLLLILIGMAIAVPVIFVPSQISLSEKTDIFVDLNDTAQQTKKWSETESEIRNQLATQDIVEVKFRQKTDVLVIPFKRNSSNPKITEMNFLRLSGNKNVSLNREAVTPNKAREQIDSFGKAFAAIGETTIWFELQVAPVVTNFETYELIKEIIPDEQASSNQLSFVLKGAP